MTLTIYKNDDFENVGFRVTEKAYSEQFLRHEDSVFYLYGIQSGWSKDVTPTIKSLGLIKRIMLAEQKKRDIESFRMDFFHVLKDNDWYKNQPVKMTELDKLIDEQQSIIDIALKELR